MKRLAVLVVLFAMARGLTPSAAQTQYAGDGTPTGLEEEIRWRVNRGRFDSVSENLARGTAYTDIPTSAGPLAPNQSITLAARHQSEDMARQNLFQHATVPGSAYYNPVTQPNPWDRMKAEGYAWNTAGENIAAGYNGAEAVYVGWWNSTGHRENMYNSGFREIGDGFYYTSTSTYKNYYTMDLGSSGSTCFFTDTLFYDANGNGVYDQGEGIANIAVKLLVGGGTYGVYDLSTSVGSFAIPIQSIAGSTTVQVMLSNPTPAAVTLSMPRDYRNLIDVTLGPGGRRLLGSFIKSSSVSNLGFRNMTLIQAPIVPPRVAISSSGAKAVLTWPTDLDLEYQAQWTTNFLVWSNAAASFQPGNGSNLTWIDTGASDACQRFYRLIVRRP